MLSDGLILPAMGLAFLGWLVPRGLALFWPEGVRPLLLLAFVSAILLVLLSAAVFAGFYLARGVPFAALFEAGVGPALAHFARLGALSALFWGPILVLSVAGLPRHWVKETW